MSEARIECPACAARLQPGRGYIGFCGACGHRWLLTTREEHEAVETSAYTHNYAGYRPDPFFVATATSLARSELARRVPPPARVLDVGCGAGDFMAVAQGLGYEVEGIDISPASAEICRSRGLDARAGNFLTEHFSGKFDLITMWDVVEHLRDPGSFLDRARTLLTPNGYLFAKIPGFGGLSVNLSNLWPRAARTLLGAPNHVQFFDRVSLAKLMSRKGFEPEWIDGGRARSGTSGGSIKRRLARNVRTVIQRVSGDANLYVAAHPAA
jgi:SAM-dependent methyltransferase